MVESTLLKSVIFMHERRRFREDQSITDETVRIDSSLSTLGVVKDKSCDIYLRVPNALQILAAASPFNAREKLNNRGHL